MRSISPFWCIPPLADAADDAGFCPVGGHLRGERGAGNSAKALSLAMLASLGGYLAPLLLSTGSGNYVALFSFYLLLSVGILAISVWQHWRELNLLGLIFTFGVGGLWGVNDYQPAFYLNCQLFTVANILLLAC